jgi:predicted ATP-binding protein involved in virulence
MEADKQGRRIRVDQLSDGEKCMLAMVGDLARRLAIANANGDFDPLGGAGIVLIDEVDLHLHPSWQHFVVPRLLETFPNCQFFVSTHSPLVLNNVRPGNLYMVKDVDGRMEVSRPGESFGKSVLRVLEDLMGLPETLPAEIGQKLKTIYSQIAFGETSAARDGISELRSSGYDEPELAKAEMLIRRRELVGK